MSTKPLERVKALVAAVRGDGWSNTLTGLGTVARDKVMSSTFLRNRILTDEELASLYEDDMGARIVDRVVEDSLRKGVLFKVKDDDFNKSRELEGSLIGAFDGLEVIEAVSDADCWGRLFGGGAVMVNTDDPGAAEEPLILESVRSVRSLMTLDKRDIWPHSWDADPGSRTFGKPLLYQIASVQMPGGKTSYNAVRLVHASRLIVFEGKRTPMRKRLENNGWSLSVLQPVHDVLRQFGVTWQSASHLMGDAAQGVWKMKGLIDMLASGQKDVVQERMRVADMSRSVARAVLIDADDEEFERKEIAMTGYSTMLEKFMVRLAAAADMPVTKLMGQSPAGLNATGESDRSLWDDTVQAHQRLILKARFERLALIVMSAKDGPTGGKIPENWEITFPPIRQMTEAETADIRLKTAQTDIAYIDRGVYSAEECAMSRFPESGWSMETKVDLEMRGALVESDAKASTEEGDATKVIAPTVTQLPDSKIVLTPSATAAIVTVNEARLQSGLDPIQGGELTIAEFIAKNSATISEAANATAGTPVPGAVKTDSADDRATWGAVLGWMRGNQG